MDNVLLTNKEFTTQGNWYSPRRKLNEYLSVVYVEYIDQTSSAGDWNGFFIQHTRGNYYVIKLSQENNFPKDGFTLFTGDLWMKVNDSDGDLNDVIRECREQYVYE